MKHLLFLFGMLLLEPIYSAPMTSFGCRVRVEYISGSAEEGYLFLPFALHTEFSEKYFEECISETYITELINKEISGASFCTGIYWTIVCKEEGLGYDCKTLNWDEVDRVYLYYVDEAAGYSYDYPKIPDRGWEKIKNNGIVDCGMYDVGGDASGLLINTDRSKSSAFNSAIAVLNEIVNFIDLVNPSFTLGEDDADDLEVLSEVEERLAREVEKLDNMISTLEQRYIVEPALVSCRSELIDLYGLNRQMILNAMDHINVWQDDPVGVGQDGLRGTRFEVMEPIAGNELFERTRRLTEQIYQSVQALGYIRIRY